ncbi:RNA polymerase sigma factor [Streptomyces sp. NPDC002073]|uniref:RNA polymerase sigma factor n=1 Tax=Streptomyces sp. NBC_00239 TaxID=2903640 RepID=UPI002E28B10A|nr:SigE family RNA polymerase sigma factor [Streptomyces sp. NBC_00239]
MLHLALPHFAPPSAPAPHGLRRAVRVLLPGLLRRERLVAPRNPDTAVPGQPYADGGAGRFSDGPATDGRFPDERPPVEWPPADRPPTVSELYHAHRLRMVRLAVLLVDDLATAEDVVQDAFTALYRRHGEHPREVDNALAYLRMAVVNTSRSVLRRRRTARAWIPPAPVDVPSAADHVVLDEAHREVLAALARLTPRRRQVLVLRYWADLSEAEIATTLGISRGAVKSNASRALDALEKLLEGRV